LINAENPIGTYIIRDVERSEFAALTRIKIQEKYFHKARLILTKFQLVVKIGKCVYNISNPVSTLIKAQKMAISHCPERLYEVFRFCQYISNASVVAKTNYIVTSHNNWYLIKKLAKQYDEMESKKEAAP